MGILIFITITILSTWAGWSMIRSAARTAPPEHEQIPRARIANPDPAERVYANVSESAPRVADGFARAIVILIGVGFIIAPWVLGFFAVALGGIATP